MNLPRYIDAVDHAVIELGETGTPVSDIKDHHNISQTEVLSMGLRIVVEASRRHRRMLARSRLNRPWPL